VSTEGTAQFLAERGIEVDHVHKVSDAQPNIIDLIKNGEISLVINIPGGFQSKQDEQMIRRVTIDHKIHLFTTTSGAFLLALGIESMRKNPLTIQPCHG
jgi:carbamoyl-phosphate synthase large subunit